MKVTVTIAGRAFEVEVGDVHARPIIATIDGERFELWPEMEQPTAVVPRSTAAASAVTARAPEPATDHVAAGDAGRIVRAPLPGVIVSVAVQPGTTVTHGQELCVLEAMKMKNAIRAARAGRIAAVRVAVGQRVRHHDVLLEFAD
jgi:biotin carboxyl carrier protein